MGFIKGIKSRKRDSDSTIIIEHSDIIIDGMTYKMVDDKCVFNFLGLNTVEIKGRPTHVMSDENLHLYNVNKINEFYKGDIKISTNIASRGMDGNYDISEKALREYIESKDINACKLNRLTTMQGVFISPDRYDKTCIDFSYWMHLGEVLMLNDLPLTAAVGPRLLTERFGTPNIIMALQYDMDAPRLCYIHDIQFIWGGYDTDCTIKFIVQVSSDKVYPAKSELRIDYHKLPESGIREEMLETYNPRRCFCYPNNIYGTRLLREVPYSKQRISDCKDLAPSQQLIMLAPIKYGRDYISMVKSLAYDLISRNVMVSVVIFRCKDRDITVRSQRGKCKRYKSYPVLLYGDTICDVIEQRTFFKTEVFIKDLESLNVGLETDNESWWYDRHGLRFIPSIEYLKNYEYNGSSVKH